VLRESASALKIGSIVLIVLGSSACIRSVGTH